MTAHLVSLDPGLRGSGIAWWAEDGTLLRVEYLRNPEKTGNGPAAWVGYTGLYIWKNDPDFFISEVPQVYRAGASKGDPDDLLQLAGGVGVFSVLVSADVRIGVKPREWKGQVPKDVHHARLIKTLSAEDLEKINLAAPPSLRHNVLDAVGIGKWWFQKNGRKVGT